MELVESRPSSEVHPPGGTKDGLVITVQSVLVVFYLGDTLAVFTSLADRLGLFEVVVVSNLVLVSQGRIVQV